MNKDDKFRTKENWITRLTLDTPQEVKEEDILCKLTGSKSGKVVITPIFPDSEHQELYQLEGILVDKDDPKIRTVNTKKTKIAGIPVTLKGKGKIIEFISVSEEGAQHNYDIIDTYLASIGTIIVDEFTVKCGKGRCILQHKNKTQTQTAIDL